MYEQSKASKRRLNDPEFVNIFYCGKGIDIGAGEDSLSKWIPKFPLIESVRPWDLPDGDAQYLATIPDETFDFISSAHCLEHMKDVTIALTNWLRVLKPKGYLIVTVPDEDMYERGVWPSQYNTDHKHTFAMYKEKSWSPVSINVANLNDSFNVEVMRKTTLDAGFDPNRAGDQTIVGEVECAIEFVWQKR